jgi:hypothetical protein
MNLAVEIYLNGQSEDAGVPPAHLVPPSSLTLSQVNRNLAARIAKDNIPEGVLQNFVSGETTDSEAVRLLGLAILFVTHQ